MHEFIELLKMFDLSNLLAIGVVAWFINRNINSKFDEVRDEFKEIHKEFKFINIRLSRVEGAVYGKDIYKKE